MRMSIPPKEMLAITLRYLASGCSLTDLFFTYRIGVSTASIIVQTTTERIWQCLAKLHFPEATQENWLNIAANFKRSANFPLCLGAIDGKHVRIQNFPNEGSMNFNYKKYHSMVLLAVADSDYKFSFVDVGGYGKDCDSNILKQTELWDLLIRKQLNIPNPAPLPPHNLKVPYVFVADEAFPMQENAMRPFGGHNLTVKQRIFNYRLSRARRFVECAFGILTNKWRIFHKPLIMSRRKAMAVIKCCTLLHNIVREMDGYRPDDLVTCTLDAVTSSTTTMMKTPRGIRTVFANCFVSEIGALPWQMSKI
ncbi:hypothetical protein JTE90_014267 [Oedothorax gibbosus]|uniref:DDE Tnp4 domain-containing protein n=1 Tax=Oedothorax gibbosus TaxID=931172 RepID=A0AAV6TIW7_9ARAC|nr:hypothetical protein JTE90_014267 [Oedothorax gibbosus]